MMNDNDVLLASLIEQGVISQEDFDKKVKEYSIPINKEKDLINSIKSADTLYQEAVDSNSDIETIRTAKINQLKQLCSQAVYDGFYSEELGYSFGFNTHDQANISQQLLLFLLDPSSTEQVEWKTLEGGVILLSKNQFLQLVGGAKTHKRDNQYKYWQLETATLSAETIEEIKAVNW